MNEVFLSNVRLVRDPELKFTSTKKAICKFSVACNDGWGDRKKTYFFDITAWEKQAENCSKYLKKGSPINLKGKLVQNIWKDKDGNNKSKVEIISSLIEFGAKEKAVEKEPYNKAVETVKKAFEGKDTATDFPPPDDDDVDFDDVESAV